MKKYIITIDGKEVECETLAKARNRLGKKGGKITRIITKNGKTNKLILDR